MFRCSGKVTSNGYRQYITINIFTWSYSLCLEWWQHWQPHYGKHTSNRVPQVSLCTKIPMSKTCKKCTSSSTYSYHFSKSTNTTGTHHLTFDHPMSHFPSLTESKTCCTGGCWKVVSKKESNAWFKLSAHRVSPPTPNFTKTTGWRYSPIFW